MGAGMSQAESMTNIPRVLLVVDDEENILRALGRLLRRDGYVLLKASSGIQGLELLAQHPVGVILSDQRMPGMTGSEFLERAKALKPDAVRLILSGYTDLQTVTDAINRGAIYRFLTKPWDDELLRENIRQAFEHYELRTERDHLAGQLNSLNAQLAQSNQGLQQRISSQSRELEQHARLFEASREVLERLPVAVLGVDDDGLVVLANAMARDLLGGMIEDWLGQPATRVLPPPLCDICRALEHGHGPEQHRLTLDGVAQRLTVLANSLGERSRSHGCVLVLVPEQYLTSSVLAGEHT